MYLNTNVHRTISLNLRSWFLSLPGYGILFYMFASNIAFIGFLKNVKLACKCYSPFSWLGPWFFTNYGFAALFLSIFVPYFLIAFHMLSTELHVETTLLTLGEYLSKIEKEKRVTMLYTMPISSLLDYNWICDCTYSIVFTWHSYLCISALIVQDRRNVLIQPSYALVLSPGHHRLEDIL